MKPTLSRAALAIPLLAAVLPAVLLAQLPSVFELEPGLAETDEEAPPIYEVEVLIFAYNAFNPLEEVFAPEPPRWPKSFTGTTIRSTPQTLQPGSADWMLESLTLPTDPLDAPGLVAPGYDSTPPLAPATAPDPAATSPPADDTFALAPGAPSSSLTDFDDSGNTFGEPPQVDEDGPWYTLLEPERFSLGRAFARLDTIDAYTPLIHTAWSQEALLEEEARAFDLALLGSLRPSGTIRLHRSRFLHLTLDLVLQDDYRYSFAPLAFGDPSWPLAEIVAPLRYRIDVQRRIRSEEVHFFDHPAFGVLITVRPQPEDPEAEGETPAGPAA